MNNQYTKDQILEIILKIVYPDKQERKSIDRAKLLMHFDWFYDFIEYCSKGENFADCMKDWEVDLSDTILEILDPSVD